jgi:hypothetical protein
MNTQGYQHPEFDFDHPVQRRKNRLRERFDKFHAENPHVFEELRKLAFKYRSARADKQIGISLLFEVLRWHSMLETQSDDGFKLSDNFRAFYARALMREPGLAGMFRTKRSAADEEVE